MQALLALLRKSLGAIALGLGLAIVVFSALAIIDPSGSQMADDANPLGSPPSIIESIAYFAIGVALCAGGYALVALRRRH